MKCVEQALENPPQAGDRVEIFNQMTETHRVRDLAQKIADMTGVEIAYLPNPRQEADENDLLVSNAKFKALGLDLISLDQGLMDDVVLISKQFAHRIDRSRIPAVSGWTKQRSAEAKSEI